MRLPTRFPPLSSPPVALLGVAFILMTACMTDQEKALKHAQQACAADPMVGMIQGAKAELEARQNQLESLKISLGGEQYAKLSQELNGYSVEWEALNQTTQVSCREWGLCDYRFGTSPGACRIDRDRHEQRQQAAREFSERVFARATVQTLLKDDTISLASSTQLHSAIPEKERTGHLVRQAMDHGMLNKGSEDILHEYILPRLERGEKFPILVFDIDPTRNYYVGDTISEYIHELNRFETFQYVAFLLRGRYLG